MISRRTLARSLGGVLLGAGLCASTTGAQTVARSNEPDPPCRVDYAIRVRYDEPERKLVGEELIQWHNESSDDVPDLWFHLYWNAFANNRSSHLVESGGELRGIGIARDEDDPPGGEWGWTRVTSIQVRGQELLPSLRWRPTDDGREDDKTVFSVPLAPIARPGEVVAVRVQWEARIPRVRRRTGYKDEFLFVAQWFPKLGVYEGGIGWNCHQFHANTEFYSDYGAYDVTLDLPAKYAGKIGASGVQVAADEIADGRVRARFVAPSPEDQKAIDATGQHPLVHDFAWTADPKYVKRTYTFRPKEYSAAYDEDLDRISLQVARGRDEVALRDVDVTVLLQPEHASQAERHFDATCTSLYWYGLWFGGYPYQHVTCVDPAWGGGAAGGMEYPTLFTAGSRQFTWPAMHTPESVTVHECGHQFWYGLVGNNEFEAAWLDEGFNTYSQGEAMARRYGNSARTSEFAGLFVDAVPIAREPGGAGVGDVLALKRWTIAGVKLEPLVSSGVLDWWREQPLLTFARSTNDVRWGDRNGYLADPDSDPVDTFGWHYVDNTSYRQNSYRRTSVNLRTLSGMVGEERFLRGMRLYSERFRYKHPYADDFFDTFCEGAEADAKDYLVQAFRSTATIDWSVEVRQKQASEPAGWFLDANGEWTFLEKKHEAREDAGTTAAAESNGSNASTGAKKRAWHPEIVVRRKGGLFLPLKLEVTCEDGSKHRYLWSVDEQRRSAWWRPIEPDASFASKVVSAVLDPERVYFLDTDMSNNQWHDATSSATPLRWSERVLAQYAQLLHWIGGIGG